MTAPEKGLSLGRKRPAIAPITAPAKAGETRDFFLVWVDLAREKSCVVGASVV